MSEDQPSTTSVDEGEMKESEVCTADAPVDDPPTTDRFVEAIARHLPGFVYRCYNRPDWQMVYASMGVEAVTGYQGEQLVDNRDASYGSIVHPEDRDGVWAQTQAALDEGRAFELQYRIRSAGGEVRWVWEQGRGVHLGESNTPMLEGYIFDISRRKRAEHNVELINGLRESIAGAEDSESALNQALALLGEEIGLRYGEAWVPRREESESELELATSWVPGEAAGSERADQLRSFIARSHREYFERGEGLPGRVWEGREPRWLRDVTELDWYRRARAADGVGLRSALAVPALHDGTPLAVLIWYTDRVTERDETIVQIAEMVAEKLGSFLRERQFEQALREQRRRFRQVAENVDEVFWLTAPDKSEILYVNPAYERIWGRSAESLRGRPESWLEAVHPADRSRIASSLDRQREGDYEEEYRIERPDGEIRWIFERAYPVRHDGEVIRIVGVARDITRRKRAEEQLQRSQEKFASAFQINPLCMSIITVEEGRFLEVNEGFTELLGYEEGEVIGRRVVDLELVVDRGIERDIVEQTADGGVVRGLETRLRRADGQQRDVLVWAKPIEIDGEACLLSAVQDITRRKRYERELEHQALHDELTGLPNQTLLRDRLDHALERAGSDGEELAVLLLDLDRFKLVNDTMGHPVGDQLLIQVGDRLRGAIRERDTVSRFGGDEFIVLLEGFGADDSVAPFVDPVVEVFETPFELGGIEVHTTASIGIARSGDDVRDTDDLIRYADVAMYQAKSPEETTVTEYDPVGNHPVTERLHLENEMRRAVDRREFVTYFQPVIDIETGDVIGAEALARWEHPEEGLIAPGRFIPLAEETGMIVPIGEQILAEAAETVADWRERFGPIGERRMFRLAVNLSARQYREENIVGQIRRAVDRSGLPLGSLVLEITESILMTGHGKLQELRQDGVRVAIDDFGTGYSSLQYLRRLEADELKIDRSFIADLDEGGREDVLVEVILTMGRKFGMDVIAEGIETARQRGRLVELGCRFGQGFLYDRPLTADDFSVKYFENDGD